MELAGRRYHQKLQEARQDRRPSIHFEGWYERRIAFEGAGSRRPAPNEGLHPAGAFEEDVRPSLLRSQIHRHLAQMDQVEGSFSSVGFFF